MWRHSRDTKAQKASGKMLLEDQIAKEKEQKQLMDCEMTRGEEAGRADGRRHHGKMDRRKEGQQKPMC